MILPQDQQEIIKRGEAMEKLVTYPEWEVFVRDIHQKRDSWLSQLSANPDRIFLSAQAHTANLLAGAPFKAIDAKNELQRLINAQLEAEKNAPPEEKLVESRPPAQFV